MALAGVDVVLAVLFSGDWVEANYSRGFRGIFSEVLCVISRNDPCNVTGIVGDAVRDVRSCIAVDA